VGGVKVVDGLAVKLGGIKQRLDLRRKSVASAVQLAMAFSSLT